MVYFIVSSQRIKILFLISSSYYIVLGEASVVVLRPQQEGEEKIKGKGSWDTWEFSGAFVTLLQNSHS